MSSGRSAAKVSCHGKSARDIVEHRHVAKPLPPLGLQRENADAVRRRRSVLTVGPAVFATGRSITGARSLPLHTMREAFWEKFRTAA